MLFLSFKVLRGASTLFLSFKVLQGDCEVLLCCFGVSEDFEVFELFPSFRGLQGVSEFKRTQHLLNFIGQNG